jgi:hypothetical protein
MLATHSWKLFVVIGAIGTCASIAILVDPSIGLGMLAGGAPAPPPETLDPFLAFTLRWTATAMFGGNAITILLAATAFRRGERWAAIALAYWPLMFLSHLLMYRWGPMSFVQIAWLALSVPAIAAALARPAPAPAPARTA